ncbi:MAG: sulfite exporter TauE/SafE family protein [Boseongicola sp.]
MMSDSYFVLGPDLLIAAVLLAFFAGFVKGAVGFALPMIMISGLGSFLAPEIALAGLIIPALVTNFWQALRNGLAQAIHSIQGHWRYLTILVFCLALSAQLVTRLNEEALFLVLGVPVTIFAAVQLAGWQLSIDPRNRRRTELGLGAFAGAFGGISGVWGPPTVMYLTALKTPKQEQMRVQGVVYGAGAVMLTLAHLRSSILNAETAKLSALLVLPALLGIALGFAVQDRMSQEKFRRATLLVLIIGGLNLIRRGMVG